MLLEATPVTVESLMTGAGTFIDGIFPILTKGFNWAISVPTLAILFYTGIFLLIFGLIIGLISFKRRRG